MAKAVKTVASIALPIAGSIFAPGIGTALGSTLSGAALSGIGGALGGAAGGALSGGGVKGALIGGALGGAGGYLANGGLGELGITGPGSVLGTAAGTPLTGGVGPTQGSGIIGEVTRNLPSTTGALSASSLQYPIIGGNIASGILGSNAADKASKLQYQATQDALAQQKALVSPYVNAGSQALGDYQNLANNSQEQLNYVQNSPFYNGLANDAQQRLLASQATAGKLASGGTAKELQSQLLNLGNNLVQQQLGNQQSLINTGANAATGQATNAANLITQGGNAQAAGTIGSYNAGNSAYQNTINSLLALQKLKQTPTYTLQ